MAKNLHLKIRFDQDNFINRLLLAGGALPRSQRMSAASWGLSRRVQARRHCSINNTQPNRSQHIPFISSTHFILPPRPSPKYKGGKQGSTTRMKKTPCPLVLRKNPSPSSANPPLFFFSPYSFLQIPRWLMGGKPGRDNFLFF